jgi:exopolysaccharide biosynthesis polyprenyl glycosylphosphotransferase
MAVRAVDNEWPIDVALAAPAGVAHRIWERVAVSMGSLGVVIRFSADLVMSCAASTLGLVWARADGLPMPPLWMMACYAPMLLILFAMRRNYRRSLHTTLIDEFLSVQMTAALAAMLLLGGMVLSDVPGYLGATVAKVWMVTAVLLPVGRFAAVGAKRALRSRRLLQSPTLIVGNGMIASHLAKRFADNPQYGILPVGFVDSDAPWRATGDDDGSVPHVGTPDTMSDAIRRTGAEAVVIAFSKTRDEELIPVIRTARLAGLTVWVVPRMFDSVCKQSRVDHVGGLPVLALSSTDPKGWQFATKHVGDRVAAAAVLAVLSPLFVFLMAAVRFSSPGPMFFRQPRVGRDGVVFDCLKFRSMRPLRDSDAAFVLTDGSAPGGVEGVDRRTWIGKIMRSSSLDELPQLLNVIRGDMSLVGPRPERPEFVDVFNAQIRRYGERHRVKAGMTGWAQVHGLRGQTSIGDRAEWDNFYIENWSLGLDLQILAMTVPAVLKRAE